MDETCGNKSVRCDVDGTTGCVGAVKFYPEPLKGRKVVLVGREALLPAITICRQGPFLPNTQAPRNL